MNVYRYDYIMLKFISLIIIIPRKIKRRVIKYIKLAIGTIFASYLKKTKPLYGISSVQQKPQLIISLTSYPARYDTLFICIKSLLRQSMKPDNIILSIYINEMDCIPQSVLELQKYGVTILPVDENLKPHKKYYYVMQQYPDAAVITVDDDLIYDKNLVKDLCKSYKKYPYAVSARRVHKITKDPVTGLIKPYNDWEWEYKKLRTPSFELIATGCGGVLYPPHCLPKGTFNITAIQKLCLNADDIWLKFMEQKAHVPVVWVPHLPVHPYKLKLTSDQELAKENCSNNQNDVYIQRLEEFFHFSLSERI